MVDTPIGTNSPNYTLVSGDVGATIFCRVTATNASGSAQAFSNAVGPVAAAGGAVPGITTPPAVTVAVGGASVSCSTGTWTNSPTGYAYQWFSDETPAVAIPGATSATYVIDGGVIVPPALTPATTNMWAWLKADAGVYSDAGTTPATNGGTVQRWADQSATGTRHFNQTTSANRPTWVTNAINSTLPVVRFDPTTAMQWLEGPDGSGNTAGEIFIVLKATDATGVSNTGYLWVGGTSAADTLYPYSTGVVYDGWGTDTRFTTGVPAVSIAAWRLYNVVATSAAWTSYFDGTLHFTDPSPTVGFPTTSYLGRSLSVGGGTNGFGGDIAEVIVYSAACSAPDKAQTKAYLATKYGLTIA